MRWFTHLWELLAQERLFPSIHPSIHLCAAAVKYRRLTGLKLGVSLGRTEGIPWGASVAAATTATTTMGCFVVGDVVVTGCKVNGLFVTGDTVIMGCRVDGLFVVGATLDGSRVGFGMKGCSVGGCGAG